MTVDVMHERAPAVAVMARLRLLLVLAHASIARGADVSRAVDLIRPQYRIHAGYIAQGADLLNGTMTTLYKSMLMRTTTPWVSSQWLQMVTKYADSKSDCKYPGTKDP